MSTSGSPALPGGITVGRDVLPMAGSLFNLARKVLIITDDGVPERYSRAVFDCCPDASVYVIPHGERNKTLGTVGAILSELLSQGFTRGDALVAVGGGMTGDITGFAAACYQRGIDWYNVPTTLLSQVDASVGGKTGVNVDGVKNIAGAFHHPCGVLIDTATLETLPPRIYAEGMAEVIKMAATSDAALFSRLEIGPVPDEELVRSALAIKMDIVQRDPTEKGERAVLNFGHTVGHAIEAAGAGQYYHGEAVAAGMPYFCSPAMAARLEALLRRFGLPVSDPFSPETLMRYASRDKKHSASGYKTVWVSAPGSYRFRTLTADELRQVIENHKK